MNDSTKSESPFSREVVLSKPYKGQAQLQIRYDEHHHFDFYPAGFTDETELSPSVILVCGFNDSGFQSIFGSSWKDTPPVSSWARLFAASGISAVALQASDPAPDTCSLIRRLHDSAADYQLDPTRMALWSCSGNVPTALSVLDQLPEISAALLMYGFMTEPGDNQFVSAAAEQFRFSHPPLGENFLDRSGEILVVRAGRDEFPGVNESIDYFVEQAENRSLDVRLIEYKEGVHAFDVLDDSVESKAVLEQAIDFLVQAFRLERR